MKYGLRELLAYNMKRNRGILGLSQAKLAEKANLSTHYVAMIELQKKFPVPETLEQIAGALEIEPPALFSLPSSPAGMLKKLQKEVLSDIETALSGAIAEASRKAVESVIAERLLQLETEDL